MFEDFQSQSWTLVEIMVSYWKKSLWEGLLELLVLQKIAMVSFVEQRKRKIFLFYSMFDLNACFKSALMKHIKAAEVKEI